MRAILGGTFDPVHRGHLHAAAAGRSLLGVSKVTLMLAARPWHRDAPGTSVAHRLNMLRLAAAADPALEASDWEVRREGPTYTVDTLTALSDDGPLVWLIGGDAFAAVDSWHRVDDLHALCHFVVFNRPGGAYETAVPRGFRQVDEPARWRSGQAAACCSPRRQCSMSRRRRSGARSVPATARAERSRADC